MGAFYSTINFPLEKCAESVTGMIKSKRKRRYEETLEKDDASIKEQLSTPKKKKLLTTPQYIYRTLFEEHRDFDITVRVLNKEWNLHKIYLSQSQYFASMFSGSWLETNQRYINIEILDSNINEDALNTVFGSLYADEVTIDPKSVISVLASARLFQLDGLIDQCAAVMIETINTETAVKYFYAGYEYGCKNVKDASYQWLLMNLMTYMLKQPNLLREISCDLMMCLVRDPDLFVFHTEFSLYTLLKLWLYLQIFPEYNSADDQTPTEYFSKRTEDKAFLTLNKRFIAPFIMLRMEYLVNHPTDLDIILKDRLMPSAWFQESFLHNWSELLKIDHSGDHDPKNVDEPTFLKACFRCGRMVKEKGFQKWRWTGFNYGLDLILSIDGQTLNIKRHHRSENERVLSLKNKRRFYLRAKVFQLNEQRQVTNSQLTEMLTITLEKNEETRLMTLDKTFEYPLYISINMLVVNPLDCSTSKLSSSQDINLLKECQLECSSRRHSFGTNYDTSASRKIV